MEPRLKLSPWQIQWYLHHSTKYPLLLVCLLQYVQGRATEEFLHLLVYTANGCDSRLYQAETRSPELHSSGYQGPKSLGHLVLSPGHISRKLG